MATPGKIKRIAVQKGVSEEALIIQALEAANGSPTQAAFNIGISPSAMFHFIRSRGIVVYVRRSVRIGVEVAS